MAQRTSSKSTKNTRKKTKKTGLGIAIWLLFALVLVIIFLVKKDDIISNLKETAFFDKMFGKTPEFVESHEPAKKKEATPVQKDEVITIKIAEEHKPVVEAEPAMPIPVETSSEKKSPDAKADESSVKPAESQTSTVKTENKKNESQKTTIETQKEEKPVSQSEFELCFVNIDSDGSINRKIIKRKVPKSDSPLMTSLNLLLAGPVKTNAAEKNCGTLIPAGTKLLSVKIVNGVAWLNFNDKFEFNENGADGYKGQLMQIVYTATQFSTVSSVRFLIEGEERDYLGSEGYWIGSPLGRSSF